MVLSNIFSRMKTCGTRLYHVMHGIFNAMTTTNDDNLTFRYDEHILPRGQILIRFDINSSRGHNLCITLFS